MLLITVIFLSIPIFPKCFLHILSGALIPPDSTFQQWVYTKEKLLMNSLPMKLCFDGRINYKCSTFRSKWKLDYEVPVFNSFDVFLSYCCKPNQRIVYPMTLFTLITWFHCCIANVFNHIPNHIIVYV